MKRNKDKFLIPYDIWFFFLLSWLPWFYILNHTFVKLTCRCAGKSILTKRDSFGMHFFCCRCFKPWIKPTHGNCYRKKDYKKHCQHPNKFGRVHELT